MIDIKELRRLAQAATPGPWYIGSGTYEGRNIYSAKAVTDDEGFTYNPVVATVEDDGVVCWDANARLIAAANPAVISELLDRLEAAEKERDILRDTLEQVFGSGLLSGSYTLHERMRNIVSNALSEKAQEVQKQLAAQPAPAQKEKRND